MMQELRPAVVGHFDLIRLHDPDYPATLAEPEVWRRVMRNLECVRAMGLILDVNARALLKGQAEPYVCSLILDVAADMDIPMAYGDDSHGVADVSCRVGEVETMLVARGMKVAELPAS